MVVASTLLVGSLGSVSGLVMYLLLSVLLLVLLVGYGVWPYRRLRHIPGPRPLPFLGNLKDLSKKNEALFRVHQECIEKYGNVFVTYAGRKPIVFVADPELVHEITVTQFENFRNRGTVRSVVPRSATGLALARDENWKKLRRTMSPSFNLHQLKGMIPHIVAESRVLCDKLERLEGKEIEVHEMLGLLTLDVMGRTAFATHFNSQTSSEKSGLAEAARSILSNFEGSVSRSNSLTVLVNLIFPFMEPILNATLPTPTRTKNYVSAFEFMERSTLEIIKQRRAQRVDNGPEEKDEDGDKDGDKDDVKWLENDFVELLLRAKDKATGEGLSDADIVAQSITFLLAGHETTANLLAYTIYLLAQHPEIADRLCEECKGVSDNPSVTELNNLSFMSNVIKEVLRLYPPAPIMTRDTMADTHLGEYFLPKGTLVAIPIYAIHHSTKFWQDPETFNPDRWVDDEKPAADGEKAKKKFNLEWLPFGAGPRSCIGMRFALIEAKVVLCFLVKKFQFSLTPGQVPLPLKFSVTMGPANGVHVRATPRH